MVFCIVQSLVMKNGFTTITQTRKNLGDHLVMLQHQQQSGTFMKKSSCCVFGGISLVSYIMSCSNRTKPLLGLSTEHNWQDWTEYTKKNAPSTTPNTTVILMLDNARPNVAAPVKTYLETLNWEVLSPQPYSPDIAPSDYYLFRSMAHNLSEQHFTSYEDTKNSVDSWIASKDEAFFRRGIRMLPEKWEKVVASDWLRLKHYVPLFHKKCPIFDQKRRKLIYTHNIRTQYEYVITYTKQTFHRVSPPKVQFMSSLRQLKSTLQWFYRSNAEINNENRTRGRR